MAAAPSGVDTIWPGYSPLEQGFLLYEPGEWALLVTSDPPPEGFAPVADSLLPRRLRGRAYEREGALPGLDGGVVPEYRIGDLSTTAVPPSEPLRSAVSTLYHEAFHRHQRTRFASSDAGDVVSADVLTREFVAMIEVERRILARAVEHEGGPELDTLIGRFLAVREARLREAPPRAREVERALERREGTAHLVAFELTALSLDEDRGRVIDAVRTALDWRLRQFGGDRGTQVMHWRAYGTGAAMGVLLDRKGVEWREEVERGAALDQLLAASVSEELLVPGDPDATVSEADPDAREAADRDVRKAEGREEADARLRSALEEFDFEEILAETGETPTVEDELEAFYALAPARLVVEVRPREPGAYRAPVSFNFSPGAEGRVDGRRTGMSRPRPGLTLVWSPQHLRTIDPERTGFDLRVEGRPVAVDAGDGAGDRSFVVLLPEAPGIRGEGGVPDGDAGSRRYPEGVTIDAEGVRYRTDLPTTVVAEDHDSVHVRIEP